jgi:hypothetical protein
MKILRISGAKIPLKIKEELKLNGKSCHNGF